MTAARTLDLLESAKIVPVVVIDDASMAVDVAQTLIESGIPCAEITLRTDAGLAALASLASVAGFVAGAGTVLTVDDVDRCADAGATFIVSPGFDTRVVTRAQERGLLALPGIATATELQAAVVAGLKHVKFFPADRLGGLGTIAALAGPFPGVRFLPSGGVGPANLRDYLAHPSVFAVSGSWMVHREDIARRDFESIARFARAAVELADS
jgi:2-dehydro-3-deoxyphosphogluconate aldolase/(4S)-4-hydroxy-2-oxoglutarate aldolase